MIRPSVISSLIAAVVALASCGGSTSGTPQAVQAPIYLASAAYVAADYKSTVQQLYVAYFGRPADPNGLDNFAAALASTGISPGIASVDAGYASSYAVRSLVDSFASSTESSALYPADGSTAQFVNAIYHNVLGRDADLAGLLFWADAIDKGGLSKPKAALSIMEGALVNTSAQGLLDAALVRNRLAVASAFTERLVSKGQTTEYVGNSAAASARAFLSSITAALDLSTVQSLLDCYFDSQNTLLTAILPGTVPSTSCMSTVAGTSTTALSIQ